MLFADRRAAGHRLARELAAFRDQSPIVLGLPRGGVVVADEVARHLGAVLDLIVVRKLGVPGQPELAMGALGEGGVRVLDQGIIRAARVTPDALLAVERAEREMLAERVALLRGDGEPIDLAGRTVIVVDDGIATGSTARAACSVAHARRAAHVVLAAPVGPPGIASQFTDVADQVVCLRTPGEFRAVGQFYRDFRQTSDDEVRAILRRSPSNPGP